MERPCRNTLVQGATLVLLAGIALYLGGKLSTLSTEVHSRPSADHLENLQQQLQKADAELETLQHSSAALQAEFRRSEQGIFKRFAALETSSRSVDTLASGLAALGARVENSEGTLLTFKARLENRNAAADPAIATASMAPSGAGPGSTSKVKVQAKKHSAAAQPPFTVMGLESRAGESFLAVASTAQPRLADIELLRPGMTFSGWRLNALESGKAQWARPDGTSLSVSTQ
ncbi:hypothetical protein [Pseudomonas gingeri]|uniref:hypothetical protein n=1 Tax=Pseudomonas gingeri TaxID=117681 RepID=UPI0015A06C74|nr:hypothetical protein [Pseudomonas gingeri]NWE28082.1 hypothetical protein [Pseudomonas gingeri]NWE94021.1 hypothetical protein [Pseudomonas gingeri]